MTISSTIYGYIASIWLKFDGECDHTSHRNKQQYSWHWLTFETCNRNSHLFLLFIHYTLRQWYYAKTMRPWFPTPNREREKFCLFSNSQRTFYRPHSYSNEFRILRDQKILMKFICKFPFRVRSLFSIRSDAPNADDRPSVIRTFFLQRILFISTLSYDFN